MQLLLNSVVWKMRMGLRSFLYDEEGDVNIVSIVVLIAIAVMLAVVFKKQISNILSDMFQSISDNAGEALKDPEITVK